MDKHSLEVQKICEMSYQAKTNMAKSHGANRLAWKMKYDVLMDRLITIITDERCSNRFAAVLVPFATLYMLGHVVKAYFF